MALKSALIIAIVAVVVFALMLVQPMLSAIGLLTILVIVLKLIDTSADDDEVDEKKPPD